MSRQMDTSSQVRRAANAVSRLAPSGNAVPIPRQWLLPTRSSNTRNHQVHGAGSRRHRRVADGIPQPQGAAQDPRAGARGIPRGIVPMPFSVNGLPVTTLLVKNVCRRVRLEDAFRLWPSEIYNFNMLYLLYDSRNNRGSGRMFLNFESHHDAVAFRDRFHGMVIPGMSRIDKEGTTKAFDIGPAQRQGFQWNMSHWQLTLRRDMEAEKLPIIIVNGGLYAFWHYVAVATAGGNSTHVAPSRHTRFM